MKLLIFGTNEISSLAKFYFENDTNYKPYGFCMDQEFIKESFVEGIPVFSFETIEKECNPSEFLFFAPLYENKLREKKSKEIEDKGYKLVSYVSKKANVFTNKIGNNCFIMENNVVQPYVSIGSNVVLWSGNHIGHHTSIEDNVFVSSHVVISGKCSVKNYSWFGVNSCVRDGVTIAEGSFISMGAVITKNTKPYTKYTGNPGRPYGPILDKN